MQAGRHTLCLTPFLSMNSRPRPGSWVLRFWASVTHLYWTEQTLSTSGTSLLNSSKQPHDPADSNASQLTVATGQSRRPKCAPALLWAAAGLTRGSKPLEDVAHGPVVHLRCAVEHIDGLAQLSRQIFSGLCLASASRACRAQHDPAFEALDTAVHICRVGNIEQHCSD